MDRKKPNRGKKSFTKRVPLSPGQTCDSLKRHYKLCAREVVGYLDKLAANDQERFVWPHVPTIVKNCNLRRKVKKGYGIRQVNYVLAGLHCQRVLTDAERVRGGVLRQGWIVAPHNAVTVVEDNCCDFQGQHHWEREIETVRDSTGQWQLKKIGPVIWPAVQGSVQIKPPNVQGTVQGTVQEKPTSVQGTVQGKGCTLRAQQIENETTCKIEARASLLSLSEPREPIEPKPACLTRKTAPENGANEKTAGRQADGVSVLGSLEKPKAKTTPTPRERWLQFIKEKDLPETMRGAWPEDHERDAVLKQLDQTSAENLVLAISAWEEDQSPPISTLHCHRWQRWLDTGCQHFDDYKDFEPYVPPRKR